jgi:hypothetical protein
MIGETVALFSVVGRGAGGEREKRGGKGELV